MNAHPVLAARQHPVVQVSNLVRSFGCGPNILDDLDLTIRAGEFVALLGRSGSGKSTLLRTLAGLDEAPAGTVAVPAERAVVFQEPRLIPWKRVWANVALGLRTPDARGRAVAALSEVGLSHRLDAWPLTLSGGEAQRAALARALVREPKLLLLDEPFAALDALTRLKTQGLVASLWQAHRPAVLLVTHDVDEALLLADRVLVLDQGRIGFDLHVNLERPRRHAQLAFATLRSRLLRELGVEDEDADEPGEKLTTPVRTRAPAASVSRLEDAVWAASADALARS
jgi:sulfonate transport system ATP-binding protein